MNRIQKIPQKRSRKVQKILKPFSRKIHLPTGIWTYRITSGNVLIRNPDCTKTHEACLTKITGMSWDTIERGIWKGWFKIVPSQVKKYIEDNYEN